MHFSYFNKKLYISTCTLIFSRSIKIRLTSRARERFMFFHLFLFFTPSSIASPFISRARGNCLSDQQLRYVARACACIRRVKQPSKAARYNWSRKAAGISQSPRLFYQYHSRLRAPLNRAFRVNDKKSHSNKRNTAPLLFVHKTTFIRAILLTIRFMKSDEDSLVAHLNR